MKIEIEIKLVEPEHDDRDDFGRRNREDILMYLRSLSPAEVRNAIADLLARR